VTQLTIDYADSKDIHELSKLNQQTVDVWWHFDTEGNPGRPASWEDLTRLERYQNGGFWMDPDLLAFHFDVVRQAGGMIIVAREDNRIVGEVELIFEHVSRNEKIAHITWIIVEPKYRRKKIGTKLMEFCRDVAIQTGSKVITLAAETQEAEAFYSAIGFSQLTKMGCFSKSLHKIMQPSEFQVIPLEWKNRARPPEGFQMAIGDPYSSQYTWTYLQNMRSLHDLLESDAPTPQLWLLRDSQEEEALTVDNQITQIWVTQPNINNATFLLKVLKTSAWLSHQNGVTRLQAQSFSEKYNLLMSAGFTLQQEDPYLEFVL
jgi:GNAT superfamily N-acetyltransferase